MGSCAAPRPAPPDSRQQVGPGAPVIAVQDHGDARPNDGCPHAGQHYAASAIPQQHHANLEDRLQQQRPVFQHGETPHLAQALQREQHNTVDGIEEEDQDVYTVQLADRGIVIGGRRKSRAKQQGRPQRQQRDCQRGLHKERHLVADATLIARTDRLRQPGDGARPQPGEVQGHEQAMHGQHQLEDAVLFRAKPAHHHNK